MVSACHLQTDAPRVLTRAESLEVLEDANSSPLPVTSKQGSVLARCF